MGSMTTAPSVPDSGVVSPDLNVAEVKSDSEGSRSEDGHKTAVTSGLVDTCRRRELLMMKLVISSDL